MGPCSFSIVVPTYNRPDILAGCLRSLDALDYPADRYEIIVVDDGTQGFAVRDSVGAMRTRPAALPAPGECRSRSGS